LRQDPDVIVLGQMHDEEMVDTALYGVETGHLILTTLDSPDAMTTISRIVGMFPPIVQRVVRHRLADSLRAIVSQRLLPRADEKGRVVVAETLVVTPEIREIIADANPNRLGEMRERMSSDTEHGMQIFDQHLVDLLGAGTISRDVAIAAASDPETFAEELKSRMGSGRSTKRGVAKAPSVGTPSETPRKGASAGAS
jgi:twitching motility protein PilT